MEDVRIGIIGIGVIGSGHCDRMRQVRNARLTAVCDIRQERLDWAASNLPEDIARFTDYKELIHSGLCDAVIVSVPHPFHPEITIAAFNAGLHVLCEKPEAVRTLDARMMNEAADRSGRVFGLMFNQRTNCTYRKMKELVSSGELGTLKRVNWIITDWYRTQHYYDSGDWRGTWNGEGGGVLLNQCPHQLDLLQWICGMPVAVTAFCNEGRWHHIEVEDDVTAYLEYPGGATGVFVTSTGDAPGTNRFEIDLSRGKLVCEGERLTCYKLAEDEREFMYRSMENMSQPAGSYIDIQLDGANPQHVGVMQAFVDRIRGEGELVANGREGINGLTLSNAMHLSSWLGRRITLPVDEELFCKELDRKRAGAPK